MVFAQMFAGYGYGVQCPIATRKYESTHETVQTVHFYGVDLQLEDACTFRRVPKQGSRVEARTCMLTVLHVVSPLCHKQSLHF